MGQLTTTTAKTTIPPVAALGTNGREPAVLTMAGLTPAQADGIACIRCGREDTPMAPAGTRDGVQLFACTPACPAAEQPAVDSETAREHPIDRMAALTDAMPGVLDKVMRQVLPEQYTPEVAQKIAADIVARLNRPQLPTEAQHTLAYDGDLGACQYRDCEDTTPGHYDHFAHNAPGLEVKDDNGPDDVIIDAGMAACSGSDPAPVVYLRNFEANNMAELTAKVDEIRRMLDATLEFGARVFADGAQA
ncbi:hypothetical protein [Streptomyces sp. MH13]|uniref:hypothetical protein n=1 Tax=Streptomyces sp. MH13 TaxID=3417651 RepID=UPI003CF30462